MGKSTPATTALTRAGVSHRIHEYQLSEDGDSYGEAVAAALGVDPARLFKTLIAEVDGQPVVGIVPVSGRLSTKALARVAGGKRALLADRPTAERLTGYVVGGISPFGRKRDLPVYLDRSAMGFETVFVSAGLRGLQVEVAPQVLCDLLPVSLHDLSE